MKCEDEIMHLMHTYLDGDLTKEEEDVLRIHLENCEECQKHFHELSRTTALLKMDDSIKAPTNFTEQVMQKLPVEKKRMKYGRWFKRHPLLVAAAVFLVLAMGGLFSSWSEDNKLVVSKTENVLVEGDTVIVPEGVTVSGDLVVKNGKLIIDGIVDGNVTLINSVLVDESEEEGLLASVGEVSGELRSIDQMFDWIWYNIKKTFSPIFSIEAVSSGCSL